MHHLLQVEVVAVIFSIVDEDGDQIGSTDRKSLIIQGINAVIYALPRQPSLGI